MEKLHLCQSLCPAPMFMISSPAVLNCSSKARPRVPTQSGRYGYCRCPGALYAGWGISSPTPPPGIPMVNALCMPGSPACTCATRTELSPVSSLQCLAFRLHLDFLLMAATSASPSAIPSSALFRCGKFQQKGGTYTRSCRDGTSPPRNLEELGLLMESIFCSNPHATTPKTSGRYATATRGFAKQVLSPPS